MHAYTKATVLAASLTTAAIALPAVAAGQVPDTDERTRITIDAPLEIPNATLAPGTYWFELMESKADQNTVRIRNEDQSKTIAMLMAVPIYRQLNEVKGDTQLVLSGTGAGAALDSWFYPGRLYGHQFVYPKEQARQIAERNKHVVLADEDGKVVRMNAGNISEPWAPDNDGDKRAGSNTARANSSDMKSADAKTSDINSQSSETASANRNAAETRANSANAAAAASSQAVGTSGADRRDSNNSSMDAEAHLDALSDMIDKALAGSGATVSIDRSTLQQMKSHVQQLKAAHDKK